MMAAFYTSGVLHSVTTPYPPSQNADDCDLFLNGLLPTMNRLRPSLPCVATRPVCSTLRQSAHPLGGGGRFHLRQWHLSSAAPPVQPRVPTYRGGVE